MGLPWQLAMLAQRGGRERGELGGLQGSSDKGA